MILYGKFEQHLQDGLNHLYDPLYEPPVSLWQVMGIGPHRGVGSLQRAMLRAIRSFGSQLAAPPDTRVRRFHDVLSYRYVQGLTQEATAEAMGITPRYVRKLQRQAISALARALWERTQTSPSGVIDRSIVDADPLPTALTSALDALDWPLQIRDELTSLEQQSAISMAPVGAAVRAAENVARSLTEERGLDLTVDPPESDLVAAVHPSALRQVLLCAISQVAHHMSSGEIRLSSHQVRDNIVISITGSPIQPGQPYELTFVREILARHAGEVSIRAEEDTASLILQVSAAQTKQKTVVVVEDNPDMITFYQSCTAGTRYEIVPVAEAELAIQVIAARKPDIIVLDVMLPDPEIDGWELLMTLRADPETRSIPVVVISVLQEKDLILSLGAMLYLPKPVRCQQFLDALDQVLSQGSGGAAPTLANHAAPC